jgi:hypothetical protein
VNAAKPAPKPAAKPAEGRVGAPAAFAAPGSETAPGPEAVGQRPCPRCEAEALGRLTPERIAALAAELPAPPSLRVEEDLYQQRLSRCGACGSLREGVLCAHCGCFVQIRAGLLNAHCPSPGGDKWAPPAGPNLDP